MIVAALPLEPPHGEACWAVHFINDSADLVESVLVEQVSYEWGDWENSEVRGLVHGPIPSGGSVLLCNETDTELRTCLRLRVRTSVGERLICAEFGRLYRPRSCTLTTVPILDRPGMLAVLVP